MTWHDTPWIVPGPDETSRWYAADSAPLRAAIDRTIENLAAIERGAWPMRIMLGVDAPVARVEWKDPAPLNKASLAAYQRQLDFYAAALADCTKTPQLYTMQPNPKEISMTIDKKDYVTAAVRTPAGSLAQRHIGSLVTITLPSGAEITDVLTGVAAGRIRSTLQPDEHPGNDVEILLANVGGAMTYDAIRNRDVAGAHTLGPKATVLVRRAKPPVATKKKGSTRR